MKRFVSLVQILILLVSSLNRASYAFDLENENYLSFKNSGKDNLFKGNVGEVCIPPAILGIGVPEEYESNTTGNLTDEVKDLMSPINVLHQKANDFLSVESMFSKDELEKVYPLYSSIASKSNNGGCGQGDYCHCNLVPDEYALTLNCAPGAEAIEALSSNDISETKSCDFPNDEDHISKSWYEGGGCGSGFICLRIFSNQKFKDGLAMLLFPPEPGGEISETNLETLNNMTENNQGICIPKNVCKNRPLSHEQVKKTGADQCKGNLVEVENEEGNIKCFNKNFLDPIDLPDEIKFEVNDSCQLVAQEIKNNEVISSNNNITGNVASDSMEISNQLLNQAFISRFLMGMEWFWSEADSEAVVRDEMGMTNADITKVDIASEPNNQ